MAKKLTPHEAALAALIPEEGRADYERAVKMLTARNRLLECIETTREAEHVSKHELAVRAGLDPASVRRMLTAQTANPTSETALRLLSALQIRLEAVLPSGKRMAIVGSEPKTRRAQKAAA